MVHWSVALGQCVIKIGISAPLSVNHAGASPKPSLINPDPMALAMVGPEGVQIAVTVHVTQA